MGILTDILVAAPSEAEAIIADHRHAQNWPCAQFKGLTPMELGDLCDALGINGGYKALICIALESEGALSIYQFPDTFPALLAGCDDEQLRKVAVKWAAGENLAFDEVNPADLNVPLRRIRELSKQALSANKSLLLWMCV